MDQGLVRRVRACVLAFRDHGQTVGPSNKAALRHLGHTSKPIGRLNAN